MIRMKGRTSVAMMVFLAFSSLVLVPLNSSVKVSPSDYVDYVIKSGSMHPTLEIDDVIAVQIDVNASQVSAGSQPDGDVIVFYRPKMSSSDPDAIIVHRCNESFFESSNGLRYFRTKGDNNAVSDVWSSDYRGNDYSSSGLISEKLLIGKVVGISRQSYAGTVGGTAYNFTVHTNSTVASCNFSQSDKRLRFDITGYVSNASSGFCNVTIPKAVLTCASLNEWQVLLNGTTIAYTATQNDTHTFVYFTYGYSLHHVEIIGTHAMAGVSVDSLLFWPVIVVVVLVVAVGGSILYFMKRRKTH